jgi:hypothetical protein
LWAITHRFQWLNRLPAAALMPAWNAAAQNDTPFDFDLRIPLPFSSSELEARCGVDQENLGLAVLAVDNSSVARALSAAILRFCPICLPRGFHATLHQCRLVDLCPVHHKRLRSRCPECRSPMAYRFDSLAAMHPYACPHCDALLLPTLAQPAGRPARLAPEQHAHLIAAQRLVERHVNCLSLPRRPIGVSASQYGTPLRARLSFLRRLIQLEGIEDTAGGNAILAARRLAAHWLRAAQETRPAAILRYPKNDWPAFCESFWEFEWDYRRAVAALHARVGEYDTSTRTTGLCDLATRLFRMTWEGVQDPTHLDQSIHPAFGIAVWLALMEIGPRSPASTAQSMRLNFRNALELVLAHAIVWARHMGATRTTIQTGRLLVPEIFDLPPSQRFDKRKL